MKLIGPFALNKELKNEDRGYELFFDFDESFDDLGLVITKVFEHSGNPGGMDMISLTRDEAQVLFDYLWGCLNYRPRPK